MKTLRGRKVRQDKPFALMARDLAQVRTSVGWNPRRKRSSPLRRGPVLLERREIAFAEAVAPRQSTLGVMLA